MKKWKKKGSAKIADITCNITLREEGSLAKCFGHCTNINVAKKKKCPQVCELWEPIEIQIATRKEKITETIENMSLRLTEIATILKEDSDKKKEQEK